MKNGEVIAWGTACAGGALVICGLARGFFPGYDKAPKNPFPTSQPPIIPTEGPQICPTPIDPNHPDHPFNCTPVSRRTNLSDIKIGFENLEPVKPETTDNRIGKPGSADLQSRLAQRKRILQTT